MPNDQDQVRELENAGVKETEDKINGRKRTVVMRTTDSTYESTTSTGHNCVDEKLY